MTKSRQYILCRMRSMLLCVNVKSVNGLQTFFKTCILMHGVTRLMSTVLRLGHGTFVLINHVELKKS